MHLRAAFYETIAHKLEAGGIDVWCCAVRYPMPNSMAVAAGRRVNRMLMSTSGRSRRTSWLSHSISFSHVSMRQYEPFLIVSPSFVRITRWLGAMRWILLFYSWACQDAPFRMTAKRMIKENDCIMTESFKRKISVSKGATEFCAQSFDNFMCQFQPCAKVF